MIEVAAYSRQQSPAGRLGHGKAQVAGAAQQLHQGIGVEVLGIQQVLLLLVNLGQPGAVDQPIGKTLQGLAGVGLGIEDHHEQQGQLAADLADVAVGLTVVKPGKAPGIQAQLEPQRGKQADIAGLVLLQLRPQRWLGHSIQVFAGEKQAEQLGQGRHLRQRSG